MDRPMYQLTEKQLKKCQVVEMPDDEHYKARGKRERKPWGILKRNDILNAMTRTPEYQRGIWQGRVDRANGLDYSEERNENSYNLGYYRGYTNYDSDRRGGVVVPQEYLINKGE